VNGTGYLRSSLAIVLGIAILVPGSLARMGTPAGQAAAANAPGTLIVAQPAEPQTLDYVAGTVKSENNVFNHITEGLVVIDDSMNVVPALAQSWQVQADRVTWRFKLRPGVKFQNGEPFNAAAAKFSIDRGIHNPPPGVVSSMAQLIKIDHATVVDDSTLDVATKEPIPPAVFLVNFVAYQMVPPQAYTGKTVGETGRNPIGTGPYRFGEWVSGDHITLKANEDYWGGAPSVKTIEFRFLPELSAGLAELQTGGVNIIAGVPPDKIASINKMPTARVVAISGGRRIMIGINFKTKPALHDKRVRQALNYAFNFDALNKGLFAGLAKHTGNIVNPPWADPNIKPYPYDPAKAKALLKQAGYESGLSLVLDAPNGKYIKDKEIVQALASDLQKVGIKTDVRVYEWSIYNDRLHRYKIDDLFLTGSGSNFEGQSDIIDYQKDLDYNYGFYNNPQFEAMWTQLNKTLDSEKRAALLHKMERVLYDDPPVVYVYMQPDIYGISKNLSWQPRKDEIIDLRKAKFIS
jgi:peptide/nickel transport system substrate-binding protein